jgi:hypothetical protein
MRMLIRAAATATGAAALAGMLLAPAASATTTGGPGEALPAATGTTTITTPDNARNSNPIGLDMQVDGIVPIAIAPSRVTLLAPELLFPNPSGRAPQYRFSLPVAAAKLSPHSLSGTVRNSGGFVFFGRHSLLEITNLVASLKNKDMTATLTPGPGNPSRRITLFRLDLSHARIVPGCKNNGRVTGIGLHFTKAAAAAMDHILSTKLFKAELGFGTATIVVADAPGVSACS